MTTRHIIVATLLCCMYFPAAAQDITIKDIKGPMIIGSGDLRDFQRTMTAPGASNKIKQLTQDTTDEVITFRDRITNLPDYLQDFIDQYVEASRIVLNGGTSWLSDPTKASSISGIYYYPLHKVTEKVNFTFPVGSNAETIKQAASNAIQPRIDELADSLNSFLPYAFLSVKFDHPEVFWIGNAYQYAHTTRSEISPNSATGEGTVTFTTTLMLFLRGSGFDIRVEGSATNNFRNLTNITKGVSLFNSSVKNILTECNGKTRYKKLREAHDWLTTHNFYNRYFQMGYGRDVTGDLPWSPLSALKGTDTKVPNEAPVCEGYARAMKVLCDAMDIPCILMSGYACSTPTSDLEGHMWNYVQMEDGKWFAIDPTWDDPVISGAANKLISGYESHKYFLVGSEEESEEGWTFAESHPEQWAYMYQNQGTCGWLLQDGPELSMQSWTPYDPTGDGITDLEDVQLMLEKIANGEDDIDDVDDNGRISVGDLVRLISRSLSE